MLAPEDAADTLHDAEAYPGAIDLLVTDVVMPAISGPELAERFRALRPRTRVLFVTGYNESELVERGAVREGVHLLTKPFSADVLAGKVRELLDGE